MCTLDREKVMRVGWGGEGKYRKEKGQEEGDRGEGQKGEDNADIEDHWTPPFFRPRPYRLLYAIAFDHAS
jgi:hypothetical protein